MPTYVTATVEAVLAERPGLQRVATSAGRAYVLSELTGPVAVGDRVVLNTTAVDLGLGTGGWHVVHWNLARDGWSQPGRGHVMKLRYTSLQADTGVAEEVEGYEPPEELGGIPVVACGLHSQVACVAAAFRHLAPDARLAYVMTDAGALPLALSDLVADLRRLALLDLTVTAGQAFGGELEAVNLASALLVARGAGADAIVCGMGPGVVGTATRHGYSGIEVATIVDTTAALGGTPVVAVRYSDADPRPRHRGRSHHTTTALSLCHAEPLVPTPDDGVPDVPALLAASGLRVTSMGRGPDEDPAFYAWAGAAGAAAARLVTA